MTKEEAIDILKSTYVELACEFIKRKMNGEETKMMPLMNAMEIAIETLEEQVEE